MLDYHRFEEIVRGGYASAKNQLIAWKINNSTGATITRRHSFVTGDKARSITSQYRSVSFNNLGNSK